MTFYNVIEKYRDFDYDSFFKSISDEDILRVLDKNKLDEFDFLTLLSPKAKNHLEAMAQKARELHLKHFGKAVVLFTPMYIANYCKNRCLYCSYNIDTDIHRHRMTYEEIEREAKAIAETELRNILILTGEDPKMSSVDYILGGIDVLKKYFESISIEIYPLKTKDYEKMVEHGVDGLSVYQETYNEEIYDQVHLSGPKKNYKFRLDAPERGLKAGIRSVTLGPLLGLSKWEEDTFMCGLHLQYLQDKYPEAELGVSVPRIRPGTINFEKLDIVNDIDVVHILLAYRIFLPYVGTNITTRENQTMRDNLVPICISKMSAGVTTEVGGHSLDQDDSGDEQFQISDPRSVREIKDMLLSKGYQPIVKDWMRL